MASNQSSDLGPSSSVQKPSSSVPLYPSSPTVAVHVPYSASIGDISSTGIQHRPVVPGSKVGQSTAVIQKTVPASIPSKN